MFTNWDQWICLKLYPDLIVVWRFEIFDSDRCIWCFFYRTGMGIKIQFGDGLGMLYSVPIFTLWIVLARLLVRQAKSVKE